MKDMVSDRSDSPLRDGSYPNSAGCAPTPRAGLAAAQVGDQRSTAAVRIIDAPTFLSLLDDLIAVYTAAMHYPEAHADGRRQLWQQHAERQRFGCVAIFDTEQRPIAFAYGYQGRRGQWWNTEVRRGVRGTSADAWLLDYAELTELHVRPDEQGRGLGERVLRAFLASRTEQHVLLSTPEGDNRAWRLYRRLGFQDILRSHHFTGDPRPFGVLGLTLPCA